MRAHLVWPACGGGQLISWLLLLRLLCMIRHLSYLSVFLAAHGLHSHLPGNVVFLFFLRPGASQCLTDSYMFS